MTQAQQSRQKVQMPEGVFGFGSAEVAYLVSRTATASSAKAAELLGVADTFGDERFLEAGASSLIARGLVTREGDEAVTLAEAELLEYVAAKSDEWLVVSLGSAEFSDVAILAVAPTVSAILQPRAVGSWFVSYVNADVTTGGEMVMGLAATFAAAHAGAVIGVGFTSSDQEAIAIKSVGNGVWELALPAADGAIERVTMPDAEAAFRLAGLLEAHKLP